MDKISVYVKGNRQSTAYYRIYQYFDRLKNVQVKYNIMYPNFVQNHLMPVSKQNIAIKMVVYIISYLLMLTSLIKDWFSKPDILVIHKRIISRIMPYSYVFLLKRIKENGTQIIWDYDDHIVLGKEVSQNTFNFLSDISNRISVTHNFLKELLPKEAWGKVSILPTTDGDLFRYAEDEHVMNIRKKNFADNLNLVWIGTSPNLFNFDVVIAAIAEAAKQVKEKYNKTVVLRIVCDKPYIYNDDYLKVENIKWSREDAINALKISHVGIMPLNDTEYNKGKGGFKLVQYMSIGLPSVGSDVGFNKQVIGQGCGFLCGSTQDWVRSIVELANVNVWKDFSASSYLYWEKHFSYQKNLKYWEKIIKNE